MSRIACLRVPRFAVAALVRAEPELRGCPLVVGDPSPRAVPIGISREAERVGVRPGMTMAQALMCHADLVIRPLDAETLTAAAAALVDVAASVSPRVEVICRPSEERSRQGEILLDATGLDRLFGSPAGVAAALHRRAERLGFAAGVAIADGKGTARLAASVAAERGESILVNPGQDAAWLARLPLSELDAVTQHEPGWPALSGTLRRLGLKSIGDFARLPVKEVGSRFGTAGVRLWRIAAGCDETPLFPTAVLAEIAEGTSLEYGVTSLEALLFVVRGLLDRLIARLDVHGLACGGLTVALGLEDGAKIERAVGVLAPTRDVKTLTMLTRSVIEAAPPHAAIETVRLIAIPDRARAAQLDLFVPAGPPPAQLATTLARLAALCGSEKIGRPVAPTGHRPEAWHVAPFAPPAASPEQTQPEPGRDEEGTRLAVRAIRPPRRAQVFCEAGSIVYVRAAGLGGRAVVAGGPWRIEAEWWTDSPCQRDYYDVQLSDGGVYRLYRDLRAARSRSDPSTADEWFIDGWYD